MKLLSKIVIFLSQAVEFFLRRRLHRPVNFEDGEDVTVVAPERPVLALDADGWLVGQGVTKIPSQRKYERLVTGDPTHVVLHWTATARGTAKTLAQRIAKLPPKGQAGSSWHICVGSDGHLWQSVACEQGAWHAGGRTAATIDGKSYNRFSVGIEIENLGRVVKGRDGAWRAWPFMKPGYKPGPLVKPDDIFQYGNHWYQKFPPDQLDALERLMDLLEDEYGPLTIVGHNEVDPTRKEDPGPWLLDYIRSRAAKA